MIAANREKKKNCKTKERRLLEYLKSHSVSYAVSLTGRVCFIFNLMQWEMKFMTRIGI